MFASSTRIIFLALTLIIACAGRLATANDQSGKSPAGAGSGAPVVAGKNQLPPLVSFSHSNSGWTANFSFADPVTEIQWSDVESGPFESTGFLQTFDPQTRRPMANPAIELTPNKTTIYVRYADLHGNWVGPFEVPFDPEVEIKRFYRLILETTSGVWLSFRHDVPKILYYTHISGYRCAIREFRIGIQKMIPDQVVALAPCDMRDPVSTPDNVDTHLMIDPAVTFVSAQLVYQDGTRSKVRVFRR